MKPETLLRALRKCSQRYGFACAYAHVFSGPESQRELAKSWDSEAEKHKRLMDKLESRLLERLNARCESCAFCSWDSGYRAGWKCGNKNASMLWVEADDHCVEWRKRR